MTPDVRADAERLAAIALAEDGPRDLTSDVTVAPGAPGRGVLLFKSDGVLAGTLYADAVARACGCGIEWRAREGDRVARGAAVGSVTGPLAPLLRAERPLLNLLQRASGIASATRAYVAAVAGTGTGILHTRKTAPGLRLLDVAAVIAGGGAPHRLDLAHTVMVKDNHWQALAARGLALAEALRDARARGAAGLQVEVESEAQLRTACAAGATRLLIDNQAPDTVRDWARLARTLAPGIEIEATGGITLDNVRRYAEAGADWISIGALTHSVRAADISLELSAPPGASAAV
ncbi:MAG TPA: carboxylating nicotinate-nucleotide diphosphorylase [Gemmatimonadales bacterium]|nr:carboxylating nicotinate-nucleotide diphosphorylase [Gemmatimonadales bacterium]